VVPVVSAVGHEIDFSIADFVADLRAPTPSAAAELLVPDATDTARHLRQLAQRLAILQQRRLQGLTQRGDHLLARLQAQRPQARLARDRERLSYLHRHLLAVLREHRQARQQRLQRAQMRLLAQHPKQHLRQLRQRLLEQERRLRRAIAVRLQSDNLRSQHAGRALHAVSPLATLDRGYAILFDAQGKVQRSAQGVAAGTPLRARLADGELSLTVGRER
jgi:exodeoxyribonuclease VII large subunit